MSKKSAGILLFRTDKKKNIEFFLVHPGGPFWQKKDLGVWTIPKGEFNDAEDALSAAQREFKEETGCSISGQFFELSPTRQKAGKTIYAWAVEGDLDPMTIQSNTFSLEWPPKSGKFKEFPEVDKAGWFNAKTAKEKINPAQVLLIDEVLHKLNYTT